MDIHSMIKPVIDIKDTVVPNSEDGWVPMDEEGLALVKPLWTSPESGGWAVMFHWKKGFKAPAHKHLGSIHAYIIKGKLQARHHVMSEGDYIYEANGVIHDETTALEDTIHLNIADGPIVFYNDDGLQAYFGWEQVEGIKKAAAAAA